MLTSLSSNAIAAKARAIYGQRLTNENYIELLRSRNISDVAAYLKNSTSYIKYLKGINEASVHRGQLESLLRRSRLEKYFSLCHYVFTDHKGFYRYIIIHLEIDIILQALMSLNSGSTELIIPKLPAFMDDLTNFEFEKISKVKTFDELLEVLHKTPYRKILQQHKAPRGLIILRNCELSLNVFYYNNLLNEIKPNYHGKTRQELTEIVLIEIELLNLSFIYRMKRYFNKTPEEIKQQLIPIYYKLNQHTIDELLKQNEKQELINTMRLSRYHNKMSDTEFQYVEDYTKRLRYIINKKMMRFTTNAPIAFFALMSLIQIEIENIITIIESIRYDVSTTQIKSLLILE